MTDLDLARLKQLADGATPGPWTASGITRVIDGTRFMFVICEPIGEICRIPQPDRPAKGFSPTICDQKYIAALSPAVVKALIERVERAEAALRKVLSTSRGSSGRIILERHDEAELLAALETK